MANQTPLYHHLVGRFSADDPIVLGAKDAPHLVDYKPSIEAYVSQIRGLQEIVREKVKLELRLTETDGAKYDHLFDTGWDAVEEEFWRWGLQDKKGSIYATHNLKFVSTGHLWVTVQSARFKRQYANTAMKSLDEIKEYSVQLSELQKPIGKIVKNIKRYRDDRFLLGAMCMNEGSDLFEDDQKKFQDYMGNFEQDAVMVRKGILSLSMVHSLTYQLEQSIDLARNHGGD